MSDKVPSYAPRCPNHGCPLEGCGFPLPKKGTGQCPVSGAHFSFEVDTDEDREGEKKDKFGHVTKAKDWKVLGDESKTRVD